MAKRPIDRCWCHRWRRPPRWWCVRLQETRRTQRRGTPDITTDIIIEYWLPLRGRPGLGPMRIGSRMLEDVPRRCRGMGAQNLRFGFLPMESPSRTVQSSLDKNMAVTCIAAGHSMRYVSSDSILCFKNFTPHIGCSRWVLVNKWIPSFVHKCR